MMKLRPFETALVIIFVIMIAVSLYLVSTYQPDDEAESGEFYVGQVDIWGTVPASGINAILEALAKRNDQFDTVRYRYLHPDEFDYALLRALADGVGPDILFVSHEKLVEMRQRIQPYSYESFPIRDVKDMFLDGAEVFALTDGLYGYPIAVDPLMMYWNRDILATEGFLEAPKTWEHLVNKLFPRLIQREFDRTVRRSVVAMGEYDNVRNAFAIVSALIIQGGSALVSDQENGIYNVQLQLSTSGGPDPLQAAADFYTRFSRPSNSLYSWNRAFEDDRRQFIAEDLAFYFGYGSEGPQLEMINPNLNFDIAEVPQGANATVRRTYGKFYALSMLKSSDNKVGAATVMATLGDANVASQIAIESDMVPAHRSAVAKGSIDTYGGLTFPSAQVSLGWLNPERSEADEILKTMSQDINENRATVFEAADDASKRLNTAYISHYQ
jgi:ABC-type glycerol-3-phosphate transport system substrate-binding protein